jgi:hypothetical protein
MNGMILAELLNKRCGEGDGTIAICAAAPLLRRSLSSRILLGA